MKIHIISKNVRERERETEKQGDILKSKKAFLLSPINILHNTHNSLNKQLILDFFCLIQFLLKYYLQFPLIMKG